MTNHYTLILRDKNSTACVEQNFSDALQGRAPSVAAWRRAVAEAATWGRLHGYRCVSHEIVSADTGRSFGRHYVPIQYEADVDDGFHLLQDAANKFRAGGRAALAEKIEKLIEGEQ